MTPAEHARLNILCQRIKDEQNPKVFNTLVEELNEFLGGAREPMPTHEPIVRCAYCRLGNEFRPMIIHAEGWFRCQGCGHNAMPLDPEFKCTCASCERAHQPTYPTN